MAKNKSPRYGGTAKKTRTPKYGDTIKMPCGSYQCKDRQYTKWVWSNLFWGDSWVCSICGSKRG